MLCSVWVDLYADLTADQIGPEHLASGDMQCRDVLVLTGLACSFSKVSPRIDPLAPSRSELLLSVASTATYRSLWYWRLS